MFQPIYRITPRMVSDLTKTQEAQTIVSLLPLPASILLELQKESKEQTILLSTRMEGHSLPESEARAAIYTSKESHEEQELFNLMRALQEIDLKNCMPLSVSFQVGEDQSIASTVKNRIK